VRSPLELKRPGALRNRPTIERSRPAESKAGKVISFECWPPDVRTASAQTAARTRDVAMTGKRKAPFSSAREA
jgi:hypothetical protein